MESHVDQLEILPPVENELTRYNYKTFKSLLPDDILEGNIVVTNMSPNKLWASQDWTDPQKTSSVYINASNTDNNEVIPGYYYDMPKSGQRAIILANGHHRALAAHQNGKKLNVRIVGPLPADIKAIPFSRFNRNAGKPF